MAKPDYARWDGIHQFTPSHAACLCCDIEPEVWLYRGERFNPCPEIVRAMETTLKENVTPVIKESDAPASQWNTSFLGERYSPRERKKLRYYTRPALREWAERNGRLASMPFLLTPAERETPPQSGPGMRADAERNLNALIGLLTLALMKRGGPGLRQTTRGREGPNLSAVADDLLSVAEAEGLDTDGLSVKSLRTRLAAGQAELEERRPG